MKAQRLFASWWIPSLALAMAWLGIASLKIWKAPAQSAAPSSVSSAGSPGWLLDAVPPLVPTVLEAGLGVALLATLFSAKQGATRLVAMASAAFSLVLLLIATFAQAPPACGCFGAITAAARTQRIGVAGGLLCLSLLAWGSAQSSASTARGPDSDAHA